MIDFYFLFSKCTLPWSTAAPSLCLSCGLSSCLLLLPLKKAQANCVLVLVPEWEAKKNPTQVSTLILCFPSALSPWRFSLFVHLSLALFGILVFQMCLTVGMKNVFFWARPQLKPAVQIPPKPLNVWVQGKIIAHPLPLLLVLCHLQGNTRGVKRKSRHGHGVTCGSLLSSDARPHVWAHPTRGRPLRVRGRPAELAEVLKRPRTARPRGKGPLGELCPSRVRHRAGQRFDAVLQRPGCNVRLVHVIENIHLRY